MRSHTKPKVPDPTSAPMNMSCRKTGSCMGHTHAGQTRPCVDDQLWQSCHCVRATHMCNSSGLQKIQEAAYTGDNVKGQDAYGDWPLLLGPIGSCKVVGWVTHRVGELNFPGICTYQVEPGDKGLCKRVHGAVARVSTTCKHISPFACNWMQAY
jgi:hypothetical protein